MKPLHASKPRLRTSLGTGVTVVFGLFLLALACSSQRRRPVRAPSVPTLNVPTTVPEEPLEPSAPPLPSSLSKSAQRWVTSTLAGMTLAEKAAQMVMVRAYGRYQNPRSLSQRRLLAQVEDLGVGGVVLFDSEVESIPRLLNELQGRARIPLLVAADLERGLSFRVRRGVVPLPYAMALGATRSEESARFAGEVTAREGRALGIHWAFAPVADVNNNPANPVINVRSFGEDPDLVSRMTGAFIEGARQGGMLTTAKHFPGHGDTEVDSHFALPTVTVDRERLEKVELAPFRKALGAGVDAVMLGHVAVPAVDPSGTPATLSSLLARELLREELGFRGLIITDAMEMGGVGHSWSGAAAIQAVVAGADIVLLPPDSAIAVQALLRGVAEGQLTEERLDESVTRILGTKALLGLQDERLVDPAELGRFVARPEDLSRARRITEASMTLLRNDGRRLPLAAERPLRLLHLVLASDRRDLYRLDESTRALAERGTSLKTHVLWPAITQNEIDEVLTDAARATDIVVSIFPKGRSAVVPRAQKRLLERLLDAGHPPIVLGFSSPYLLAELPKVPVFLCAYGPLPSNQRAAVAALFGEIDVQGKLPVTLPGLYPYGHGLENSRREMTLQDLSGTSSLQGAGIGAHRFRGVSRVLAGFLEKKAFPGAVLAVGYRGNLVHFEAVGRLSYEEDSRPVAKDTIYDLASLTKILATTTMAMMLVDEGDLDLDHKVQHYLPRFVGTNKEKVTVRQLLTHSSGVNWWAPLYKDTTGQSAYLEKIQAMDLVYEPGTKTLYSDLGLMLLGEILERVAGQSLEDFSRQRIFDPLGMKDTRYKPGPAFLQRIAPTEEDKEWRKRVLLGEVHDENAYALGGVAPHAGLFGTARDLARFAQMILNGGVFEHRRYISRETVATFTRRAGVPDSSRALGWDTKSAEGSSAGTLFSPNSFGHTGFTGTSLWIDPERELFVILLTNRVHPTRDNILIRKVRPAIADAVVRALAEPLGDPRSSQTHPRLDL